VGADREKVGAEGAEVDGHVARGLGGVDVHEHAALTALGDDGGDGLQRAHLVVAPLQVHHRRIGTQSSHYFVRIDAAQVIDADPRDVVPGGGVPDGRVLDDRTDDVRPALGRAPHGGVARLRRPAREHDLTGARAEKQRHLLARRLHGGSR
jgi:hypothetical protein